MRIKSILASFEEVLAGAFLLVMVLIVIINVFLRYFSDLSIFWAEEVATICFVWGVFIGAAASYKHKMDIGIDFFLNKISERLRPIFRLLATSVLLLINGYIFAISIIFTGIAIDKPTAVLGVSSAVVNSALILAFGLISFHSLRFWWRDALALKSMTKINS